MQRSLKMLLASVSVLFLLSIVLASVILLVEEPGLQETQQAMEKFGVRKMLFGELALAKDIFAFEDGNFSGGRLVVVPKRSLRTRSRLPPSPRPNLSRQMPPAIFSPRFPPPPPPVII